MSLSASDYELVVSELDRDPTPAEEALFENLWSEHCAYRSSRPLLSAFDSNSDAVVVGPGDDAAVVALSDSVYITLGIESHNHPSYVDPYDGAATGVGGIVRDTMSMGAYPIALTDSLYFGSFADEHPRYLFEGVVEGIADYGNSIGVPTVGGSVVFHPEYAGNPLVNVACVGVVTPDRLVTAEAQNAGNTLVLVGNATGRDGLGGASFASEDLSEDAETEDRPAVQVGDPYTEKLLIEANEALLDEELIESARDLGAAGLGGASSELVAKGGLGARIELDSVHQREPNMSALEILLAESQERMCYEVAPEHVDRVQEIADRFDLGSSVIGTVTEGNYVCTFDGETVVDVPADYLADGAPMNDLDSVPPTPPEETDLPTPTLETAFESVLASPSTASKRWVYRQYDHEVGTRTIVRPGDDAAVLAARECEDERGIAIAAGSNPNWTALNPYDGARAVALEVTTNLAAKGATPLAAVDCLNGGNPETPSVYGGFKGIVDGLADMCRALSVPVVGGNVSLYNDSASGPIPPTPTLAMVGTTTGYDAPPLGFPDSDEPEPGTILLIGDHTVASERTPRLGGSEYLAQFDGTDAFPTPPGESVATAFVEALAAVATDEHTKAVHDVSHGGLAVALAEMISENRGAEVTLTGDDNGAGLLFHERTGRAVVETTAPTAVRAAFPDNVPVERIGYTDASGELTLTVNGERLEYDAETVRSIRGVLDQELD
ncbi:phosphoribosylformylglycinamidine synthase subunit PurL [Halocatena pleomorpha]|uniref:Phosphoribosylformylglycinamidine synthase subunit PurL n=1 Tax=Halocatena pleomorpha TaxID=1785090 RepID=A0A3P3RMD7_9EURY|nr:phosphoribosylformylglycinamidine synthase subunit PurL [Halocatena pleomorpha]RRJ33563.1 phosphoribosylformylglycinamidine synthase subunit PurL [Halocatena pleomorpha]